MALGSDNDRRSPAGGDFVRCIQKIEATQGDCKDGQKHVYVPGGAVKPLENEFPVIAVITVHNAHAWLRGIGAVRARRGAKAGPAVGPQSLYLNIGRLYDRLTIVGDASLKYGAKLAQY